MNFSFNSYDQINTPKVFLSYPNKKLICCLNAKKIDTPLKISGFSSVTFKIYKYKNTEENKGYDNISVGKYIFVDNIGWFRITDMKETMDSVNPYREITCYDLSIELTQTLLTSFGSMGAEDDEQGGLDRYALYDYTDPSHSIAHIFMNANPGWTFKYIDPEISTNHRSFNNDSVTSYEFLTTDVSEAFGCAFIFNGNDRTVSAYKPENLGKEIPFIMSFQNLLKEINIQWKESDIKTVFHVSGGTDATGTALSIAAVNPDGNDTISNFSYFYKDMSAELVAKLEEYTQLRENSKGLIATALAQLKVLQDELLNLNNKEPSVESSTDWSEYGLVRLKAKHSDYKDAVARLISKISIDPVAKQQHDTYSDLMNAVNAEITVRQNQITAKEAEITAKIAEKNSYAVNMQDILGDELYKELQPFRREQTLNATSYVATDSMTDVEVLQMKQDLYDYAVEELNRVCYPQFDMTIDSVNFPVLKKYEKWTKQLELGDIVLIKYSDKDYIKARVLSMDLDWEDFTKFSLTFSSKTSLTDGYFFLKELKNMIDKTSTTVDLRNTGYSGASKKAVTAYNMGMQEFLDLSIKQIGNTKNQRIVTDDTGTLYSEWLPDENKFAPKKLWITNGQIVLYNEVDGTNLKVPNIAIGGVYINDNGTMVEKYGVAAPNIWGDFTFSKYLTVKNENNTITMNQNGFKALATNGFSVQINPDTPDNIFTISENSTKLMYIDAVNRKLVFKGRAEIDEGLIANWNVSTNKLYSGGVGMSSDTTAGAIAYWAGNSNPTSAPFWVNNLGKVHTSNIEVTGGTLTVGSNFSVNSAGVLTAKSVNITNGYINMGNGLFTASGAGVNFGDYYVSADGTGTLRSSNGLVNITDVFTSGPSGELSRLTIGSDLMYDAVEIRGTGDVNTARVTCRQDCYFEDNWTAGMGALSMFKQIYNRLDAIRYSIQNMGGNVDWD